MAKMIDAEHKAMMRRQQELYIQEHMEMEREMGPIGSPQHRVWLEKVVANYEKSGDMVNAEKYRKVLNGEKSDLFGGKPIFYKGSKTDKTLTKD